MKLWQCRKCAGALGLRMSWYKGTLTGEFLLAGWKTWSLAPGFSHGAEQWIQKATFKNEQDGKQRVKVCVCYHESGRRSRGPQSVGWSRWGDVRVFSVAWERRCSCATSLQATANKWIFFFHLPISRILFYSPFTGELGEMAVEREWMKTYAHDLHCSNALQKYIDQR